MSYLDKLNISNRIIPSATPSRRKDTPEYRRRKLISNIEEQIELANLAIQGKPIELRRKRGHDTSTVRPRLWWKQAPDGKVFTQIRYNRIAINLAGRGTSIEVDELKHLPSIYRTIVRAVKAQELDLAIEGAAGKKRPNHL
ncbi:MAG: hypothetical protein ACI9JL_004500 [Paracoccaceae bacterium]|jgi:hypothetical protein